MNLKNKTKDWIIGAAIALAFIVLCGLLEEGPEQQQIAADQLKSAVAQERQDELIAQRERKAREAYMNHLLALDKIKETGK